MVAAYEEAGVRVHLLEPDAALPYQVFARDSSAMTTGGAVITQLHQWWRRGEYAAAIRFYQENEIPIRAMITAGALEGGDVMILEPGCAVIGAGEARTQEQAARQLAGWLAEDGWEVRVEPIPERFVHIDVLLAVLAERLAAVCADVLSAGFVTWLRERGFELIEVPADDAFQLGGNAISLGDERVLSIHGADALNAQLRARGLAVSELDLSMFTLGGRRRPLPCAGASPPAPRRADERRTGDRRRPGDRRPARARSPHRRGRRGPARLLGRRVAPGALAAGRAARRDRA